MLRPLKVLCPWRTVVLFGAMVLSAGAQVYQTTPNFLNPTVVTGGSTNQNGYASPVSGHVYSATNRPVETGTKRYQIATWTAGATFSAAASDFFLGGDAGRNDLRGRRGFLRTGPRNCGCGTRRRQNLRDMGFCRHDGCASLCPVYFQKHIRNDLYLAEADKLQ